MEHLEQTGESGAVPGHGTVDEPVDGIEVDSRVLGPPATAGAGPDSVSARSTGEVRKPPSTDGPVVLTLFHRVDRLVRYKS
ncbi:hypothetical protein [Nakamurella endophytica]|uniref:Uncharacterized protein n=1 Tax=Nakamurella endophytica TaxID=1748367 RepID=A0A917SWY2_9ACTN|nr:hypothetical protein [Nakamurella endophytica]GGM02911.1 hypothetical protein GCM10011594_23800 [Nakamurella endophytica]